MRRRPHRYTLFPYTTLFRSGCLNSLGTGLTAKSTFASRSPVKFHEPARSEEHTSELQSHVNLVCRLLLEKKKEAPCSSLTALDYEISEFQKVITANSVAST